MPQELVEVKTESVVRSLARENKLEASWAEASRVAVSQEESEQGKVWVVQYENGSVTDTDRKSLYVVLDEMGNTLSATHAAPR